MMSVEGFWISKGYLLEGRFKDGIGKVGKVQKLQLVGHSSWSFISLRNLELVLAMFGGEHLV
jgi:hypothetical protein